MEMLFAGLMLFTGLMLGDSGGFGGLWECFVDGL